MNTTKLYLAIFFLLSFVSNVYAVELVHDKFTNYSDNGYSRDDGWKNQLKVKGKKSSSKTYDFSNTYANTLVTITFKMKYKGGWDKDKDYFKVYANDILKVNDNYVGSSGDWNNYSRTGMTDSNGKLKIKFYADSTKSSEYIAIDDVIITGTPASGSSADLKLSQLNAPTPNPVEINNNTTFSFRANNDGPDTSKANILIKISYNYDIDINSLTPDGGFSCDKTSGNLTAGSYITCTKTSDWSNFGSNKDFTIVVNTPTYGTLTQTALISSLTTTDPSNANNTLTTSVTINDIPTVNNADDLCYDSVSTNGFCTGFISFACTITTPIKNLSGDNLTNVQAALGTSSLFSAFSGCGVDGSAGNCSDASGISMMAFSAFNGGINYTLPDYGSNASHTTYNSALFSFLDSPYDWVATYEKNGIRYTGVVSSCNAAPNDPVDEIIPTDPSDPVTAECDTFADMFQTRGVCSGTSGGSVTFSNAGQLLTGSTDIIIDNSDSVLNTCDVIAPTWVTDSYETCGTEGDCNASGSAAKSLTINYTNLPVTAVVSTAPSSSSTNEILNGTRTLSEYTYNNITTDWHTNTTTNFAIINRLKINSLKLTTNNSVYFNSSNPYSLEIGTLGIENNGASNSLTTDVNAKNISIATFNLAATTDLTLQAAQTIKMNSLTVGRGSNITLKAPYVNINDFTSSNSGSGQSIINIYADYIDFDTLALNQTVQLNIYPYTSGKRILFRTNTFNESSSSEVQLSSGNYYVNTSLTIPGTSDVSALRAIDSNQMINFYINSSLTLGNNPGLNASGNNGNYTTDFPATNFMLFINGDLTTGGGGTTINATIYSEGDVTLGNPTYIKGAISANSISVGQGQFTYDQTLNAAGFGSCEVDFTCANPKEFTEIFKTSAHTKMLLSGNSSLCKRLGSSGHTCDPNGASRSTSNNGIYMINNDFDTDPVSTINSSAAEVDIPAGKEVLWAGLFWQGYMYNKDDAFKEKGKSIKYKIEGDNYQSKNTTSMNWVYFSTTRMYYQSFLDITEYVKLKGGGFYWVADIATSEGQPGGGSYGAWSIAVVYKDKDEKLNNTTVFHGYKAFAGTTDINNAITYANNNGCDQTNTGVGNSVSSTLSGFLTPKAGPVESSLIVFAGEGDTWGGSEHGYITDKNNNEHTLFNSLNPDGNIMNATITRNGTYVTNGKPHYSDNSLGIDIDTYDLTGILNNSQTSTQIKFTTGGDGYMPGMYALETELRAPKLCFDYAYEQNGISFTEENNGSKDPEIIGTVSTASPIEVKLYIVNLEDSDAIVSNMRMNVFDIDTTNAKYATQTAYTTIPNTASKVNANKMAPPYDKISDIQIGEVGSLEYFYLYYNLNPVKSIIDMPLKASLDYNVTLPIGGGTVITIPYTDIELDRDIEMCSNSGSYTPEYGIFNIVHNNYYTWNGSSGARFYNLPTQITKREGNFKVIALDVNNTDDLITVSTVASVEMISVDGFHLTEAQCQDPSASISDRVWVVFNNSKTTMFDKNAIANSMANGLTTLSSTNDFYKTARPNAAFRVSYNMTNDGNSALVQVSTVAGGYSIDNREDFLGDMPDCNTTCPSHILTGSELRSCMECAYGYNTEYVCSRDNFSIRPESFLVKFNDVNQSNIGTKLRLFDNVSGVNSTTYQELHLASGYNYNIEINATNHLNNDASFGYTKTFNATSTIYNSLQYIWEPRSGHVVTGCNDITNISYGFGFNNGILDSQILADQVGQYRFHVLDTSWTDVDHLSTSMSHHTGVYFTNGKDCIENNNSTQFINSSALNGCNISSEHINNDAKNLAGATITLQYKDYDVELHPYRIDTSNITPTFGTANRVFSLNDYIYMADMSQDRNMSLHFRGNIVARGENNISMSNFVNNCFAKPLDININRTNYLNNTLAYQYRFIATNTDSSTAYSINGDLNNTTNPVPVATSSFPKGNNGQAATDLNLNFNRSIDNAVNSETITFNNYSVDCSVAANCTMNADLTTKTPLQTNQINKTLKHFYARTYVPRQRFTTVTGTAPIYYEIYCDANGKREILPNALNSRYNDDPRWFVNTLHTNSLGSATSISQKVGSSVSVVTQPTGNAPDSASLKYTGSSYPYTTTMSITPSSWLIYNKYNPSAATNDFIVEFINSNSAWAGKKSTDTTTKTTGSATTNRRSMW